MKLLQNKLYLEDLNYVLSLKYNWDELNNKTVLISGSTGLIGSFLIDVLMNKPGLNCNILALGRDKVKAQSRFDDYWDSNNFKFIPCDIIKEENFINIPNCNVDYIIHAASNTHPVAYSTDPIGTITTNIIGTNNLLKFAVEHKTKRFLFLSSNEIYGENRGDVEKFDESYCGYINSNTLRAGYPESKRCGEALCQAYLKQKSLDTVVVRLTRSYGPTMLSNDSKALSQFIGNCIEHKDIVLKSEGNQYFSYIYVVDAISGILKILLDGKSGEAYNISDELSDIKLKELASLLAEIAGTKVIYDLPDETERTGFRVVSKARLDNSKLKSIGWTAKYDIKNGLNRTIEILKAQKFF